MSGARGERWLGVRRVPGRRGRDRRSAAARAGGGSGSGQETGQVMRVEPNSNLFGSRTALAMLRDKLPVGEAAGGIRSITAALTVPAGSAAG